MPARRVILPESYVAFGLFSLQTPLKGLNQQVCPSIKVPPRLLADWEAVSGEAELFTRDRGPVTIISPRILEGAGVRPRKVQKSGLITLPPDLGRALAGPNEQSVSVGIMDYTGESLAVVASQQTIARRLGLAALSGIGSPDQEAIGHFRQDILLREPDGSRYAVLDAATIAIDPVAFMHAAFPEIVE